MSLSLSIPSAVGSPQSAVGGPSANSQSAIGNSQFLTLPDASRRSGLSVGHIRRLCAEQWLAAGLAVVSPAGQWSVAESADPRFAAAPPASEFQADLRAMTDRQRADVAARRELLLRWERHLSVSRAAGVGEADATERFCRIETECGRPVSRGSLYKWRAAFRSAGDAGLIDGRALRYQQSKPSAAEPFLDFVKRLYLDQRRRSVILCWELACHQSDERGWEKRSLAQTRRFISTIPAQVVALARHGRKGFETAAEPAIKRDYSGLASNEMWCSDHHRLDVFVNAGTLEQPRIIRPWLTAWQDLRSRKIVGHILFAGDPNTQTILRAFVQGAQSHGLPTIAYVDNGKDYDSEQIQGRTKRQRRLNIDPQRITGAFQILSIQTMHAWPYHGQSKPIERFFGTVCERFSKLFETYCGKDTASKPDDLQRHIDAGRAPLLADFAQSFQTWLDGDYHARVHTGDSMDGLCPAAAFDQHLTSKRALPIEMLRFACMERIGPVTVRRDGVRWHGMDYGGFDAQVQQLMGRQVLLAIDPADVSAVHVLDLDGRLLCQARANRSLPVRADRSDLSAAIREKRRVGRTSRAYMSARPRLAMDTQALMERAAAERIAASVISKSEIRNPDTPAPSIQPARTPFDEQFEAIRRAVSPERQRIAVGAESLRLSDLDDLRPTHMRITPADEDADTTDPDIFGSLSAAVRGTGGEE
jgi:hypothetical protein